jgi:hypothetical protein
MSAAQDPDGAAPSPDAAPELEPLPPPDPQGDAQLCDSHMNTGPSQVEHVPVMQVVSWDTHIDSRQVMQLIE